MTQIQETFNEGLKREFNIKVAKDDLKKKVMARLEQIGKGVTLPGFRPGKVPMPVLQKRFALEARSEVIDQTVAEVTQKAMKEHNLRPAAQPKIELISFSEGQDLEFKLALEIIPEITPGDFSKIKLERVIADVEEKTITDAIERIAKSVRPPQVVTEKRAAKMGDTLVIDFNGSLKGEPQPDMTGKDYALELGSKSFIDTFEDQLVGSQVGDEKSIKVTFPKEYHAEHLAGQKADFNIHVKELRASPPMEMDDALAKELGLATFAELKDRVTTDLAGNYSQISRAILKRHLLDQLAKMHTFEVPPGLVEGEFANIWKQLEENKQKGLLEGDEAKKSDEELKKEYQEIAIRRIRLGLLLTEVAQREKIDINKTELRDAMIAEARRFPGQEKAVIEYYSQTEGALDRLRTPLLEEKVVDHILSQTKITDKKIPADQLIKMPREME